MPDFDETIDEPAPAVSAATPTVSQPPWTPPIGALPVRYILSAGDDYELFREANAAAIELKEGSALPRLTIDAFAVKIDAATGIADVVAFHKGEERTFPGRGHDVWGSLPGTYRKAE